MPPYKLSHFRVESIKLVSILMNNLPKSPRVELIDCFQPVLAIRPLNEKQITDRKCTKVTNNGIAKGNSRNSNRATIIATNNTVGGLHLLFY